MHKHENKRHENKKNEKDNSNKNKTEKKNIIKEEIQKTNNFKETLKDFYIKEYKKLFLILVFLTLLSVYSIINTYTKTGDFTYRDVSLKGGISLSINTDFKDIKELESYLLSNFQSASFNLKTVESGGKVKGIIIEASDVNEKELLSAVQEKIGNLKKEDYNIEIMSSSLGASFFNQMFVALGIAFLFMGIVFHLYFRNMYATFSALLSAFLDLFITLGIMNFLSIRLTAGGIAAYLMLIGYSVDTSILLSTKLLKEKKDDINKALFKAMKTGLTMSFSGLVAMGLSYLLTNNEALKQIMLILVVGLLMDIITTWIGNVTFLRIYLEKKNVKN